MGKTIFGLDSRKRKKKMSFFSFLAFKKAGFKKFYFTFAHFGVTVKIF